MPRMIPNDRSRAPRRPIPAATAAKMKVSAGLRVEVITAEPDIVQPIACTSDDRGRLWLLENRNYPEAPGKPIDRIIVLEDTASST
jgi:hypothetical protein